jgi:hypothetical protein
MKAISVLVCGLLLSAVAHAGEVKVSVPTTDPRLILHHQEEGFEVPLVDEQNFAQIREKHEYVLVYFMAPVRCSSCR